MYQFRWSFSKLVIGLAVFFNIERLDFAENGNIDIHSFIYVLGLVAVLSILIVPWFATLDFSRILIIWLPVYLLSKLLFINSRPVLGGIYTYLTLTEVTFFLLLLYLAFQVARQLRDFEAGAEFLALAGAGRQIAQVDQAAEQIQREMSRSRHYNRTLSVIAVKPDEQSMAVAVPRLITEIQRHVAARFASVKLANLLKEELRVVDTILEESDGGGFLIICPEVGETETPLLKARIRDVAAQRLGLSVNCGSAAFPDEAVTFEDLSEKAIASMVAAGAGSAPAANAAPDAVATGSGYSSANKGVGSD